MRLSWLKFVGMAESARPRGLCKHRINLQSQGNRFHPLPVLFPNAEPPIDELSTVCQAKFTRSINQVTNKIPNSSPTQVSLPCSTGSTALRPPSFPSQPGSSILIDCCSEGSLTEENYARCSACKQLTHRRQRTSFVPHLATTAYRLNAM